MRAGTLFLILLLLFPWPALAASPAPPGEVKIQIDVSKRRLTVLSAGKPFKSYPVCVGKPQTPTPVGDWKIVSKSFSWGGGFGSRWLGLNVPWGIYGIHGTNNPSSIGRAMSHGCIRMYNRDVEEIFPWVKAGTPVEIVGVKPEELLKGVKSIKKGKIGPEVVGLQRLLKEKGFYGGNADGRYGELTALAVRLFQAYAGLPPTGEADKATLNALLRAPALRKNLL